MFQSSHHQNEPRGSDQNSLRRTLGHVLRALTIGGLVFMTQFPHAPAFAQGALMPVEIPSPVTDVFVPVGFDDNDTVEIVLHGHFANTCFKSGPAFGFVDSDAAEVRIISKSLSYPADECLDMRIPFVQSVKLGRVPQGTYTVTVNNQSWAGATLKVGSASSSSADEYLYAPVEQVDLLPTDVLEGEGFYDLTVKGVYPYSLSGCMKITDLKILDYETVLIVLPIASFLQPEEEGCVPGRRGLERRFEYSTRVQLNLTQNVLVHVRVLNGQSLNKVLEIVD